LFTSNITFVYQGLHKEKDLRLFPPCSLISNTESRSLSPCSVFCFCLDKKLVSRTLVVQLALSNKDSLDLMSWSLMLVSHKEY